MARTVKPRAVVWKGSQLPAHEQGIKVHGTPLGHPAFVAARENYCREPSLAQPSAVQSAWLLLLHCASARANYLLRVVSPEQVQGFAENHDTRLWACLCAILGIPPDTCQVPWLKPFMLKLLFACAEEECFLLFLFASSSAVIWDAEDGVHFQHRRVGCKWSVGHAPSQFNGLERRRKANPSNHVCQERPTAGPLAPAPDRCTRSSVQAPSRTRDGRCRCSGRCPEVGGGDCGPWRGQCAREGSSRSAGSRKIPPISE